MGSVVKPLAFFASRCLQPLACQWARPGYFDAFDPAQIAPRSVALIACHWIGDTFWATQVLPALQRRFSQAEFSVITKPHAVDLWHGLLPPDHIVTAPEVVSDRRRERVSWSALKRKAAVLRERKFDLAIDLTGNPYSAYFTWALRPAVGLGFGGGALSWLYSLRVTDAAREGRHLSERPFRVIEPLLGAQAPSAFAYALPLRPPPATCSFAEAAKESGLQSKRLFMVVPGAGWPEKEWGAENFAAVARDLSASGAELVISGSAAQLPLLEKVAREAGGACVSTAPVGRTVALLQAAEGVLCNDSALGHLAAACGVRVAVIFTGATDPQWYAPLGHPGKVVVFGKNAPVAQVAAHMLGREIRTVEAAT